MNLLAKLRRKLFYGFIIDLLYVLEIDECEASPCVNGECVDKLLDYECRCERGWNGTNCDEGKLLNTFWYLPPFHVISTSIIIHKKHFFNIS